MTTILRTLSAPLASYPNGNRTSPSINISDQAKTMYYEVARCTDSDLTIWPNTTTILQVGFDISLDNGNTWEEIGSFIAAGGKLTKEISTGLPFTTGEIGIIPGINRKGRIRTTITGGPLRTEAFVEIRG